MALAPSNISTVHRWLGQAARLGLVPQHLDGPKPGAVEPANQGGSQRLELPSPVLQEYPETGPRRGTFWKELRNFCRYWFGGVG